MVGSQQQFARVAHTDTLGSVLERSGEGEFGFGTLVAAQNTTQTAVVASFECTPFGGAAWLRCCVGQMQNVDHARRGHFVGDEQSTEVAQTGQYGGVVVRLVLGGSGSGWRRELFGGVGKR